MWAVSGAERERKMFNDDDDDDDDEVGSCQP